MGSRSKSGFAEDLNRAGGMPSAFRNHLVPTGCDTPASGAASSLLSPAAIARKNLFSSSRPAIGGLPGDGNAARPDRADRRFRMLIATSGVRVLRRPLESALHTPVGVVDEASAVQRAALMKRLLERIENKAGVGRAADPPADDPPADDPLAKGVDDEGDIDEAGPGREWPGGGAAGTDFMVTPDALDAWRTLAFALRRRVLRLGQRRNRQRCPPTEHRRLGQNPSRWQLLGH